MKKEIKKQKSGSKTSKKPQSSNVEFGEEIETEYGKQN